MSLATELQAIIDKISEDEVLLYTFVNGDINTVVNGAGGPYPSLAKLTSDLSTAYTKQEVDDFLALKATLESPALTGNPTAPTQSPLDNSTKIATTAYVDASVGPSDKGFFLTEAALVAEYPTGQDGWYAVVGETDTVWTWDSDTQAWKNTDTNSQGTVTSIDINDGNGITSSGGPVTLSGDITVGLDTETQSTLASVADKAPIGDPTFTGTATIPTADITTADITTADITTGNITTGNITTGNITTADFNAAGLGGELSWNDQEKTLNLATGSGAGADEVVIQVGQEVVLYAKNKSNVNMTNGQVVLVSGTAGQEPSIELAQADTVGNARRAIGVITQDIADNTSGFVTLIGKVRGLELDENTFSLGEVVYLSSTVAGGITTVQPDISVEIGHVVDVSSGNNKQGVLEVQLNNESAVYELEQELTTAIGVNATDIGVNATAIGVNATDIGVNATAIGVNATAIGVNATDIGVNATAIGVNTTDIGVNATDIATNATAIGVNTTDIATNATAIGVNTTDIATNATDIATNATAIGVNTTDIATNATDIGVNTTAIGVNATDIGVNATDIGVNTTAIGVNATDIGVNTTAIGVNATAIGVNTTDIATNTTAIGVNTTAIGVNATAIGVNATAIDLKAPLVDPAFTTTPEGSATINNNSILTDFNVGLDVQAHSDILDATTASFTEAQANAIIDNYAATPHNTDSVIICNQGDNIQAKYDEAAVLSISNKVTLLLMAGTYGDLAISNAAEAAYGVDVIGVGTVSIGDLTSPNFTGPFFSQFKNFTCNSLNVTTSFNLIEDIRVNGSFSVDENLGIIRKVSCSTFYTSLSYGTIDDIRCDNTFTIDFGGNYGTIKNVNATNSFNNLSNTGTIKNCKSSLFLGIGYNEGIIDNCHSTSTSVTSRSFFGNIGSSNQGTIKNCTAKGDECFGQQGEDGVTEYCTSRNRGFAGVASNLDFSNGLGVQGTYRNCVAGSLSFLGNNNTTDGIKIMEATYVNCSAGANSFGFVNTAGAETHFSGTAINCTSGVNSFLAANNGATKILAGAVIENCAGGNNSFATNSTSFMEGTILRCRTLKTGATAFKATGTGKVRLCLDGNYNEVNLG